jgi:hypothetical protein
VKVCTAEQYRKYLESFATPNPADRSLIQAGRVGLIELRPEQFRYSRDLGYAFEVAAVAEEGAGRRLLFIRIDSYDPGLRAAGEPVDYCIPVAYDGASARERLTWTIPFGGGWSDAREEGLLVFESDWAGWFRGLRDGVAFTNPGAESACFLRLSEDTALTLPSVARLPGLLA